jgi:uncharacterized protein
MKLFLVFLIVVAGVLLWKYRNPIKPNRPTAKTKRTESPTNEMVVCAQCALHIPVSEAFQGSRGSYCSSEHRRLAES